jgi:hypothetical protein
MKKTGEILLGIVKFIIYYVLFFAFFHFGLLNIVLYTFGKNTFIGELSSAFLDVFAVLGGILFAFLLVVRKKQNKLTKDGIVKVGESNGKERNLISWDLNKLLKLSIILGILLTSLSISYYFFAFLPTKVNKKEKALKECSEWAEKESRQHIGNDKWQTNYYLYDLKYKQCLDENGVQK